MVIGAGKGGTAILNLLSEMKTLKTRVIIDKNLQAPGILIAKKEGIPYGNDWRTFIDKEIDIIIDVTGDEQVYQELQQFKEDFIIVPGSIAEMIVHLFKEKEQLIRELQSETIKGDVMLKAIIHSSNDAISVVDENGNGILINPAYTRITGLTEEDVLGKPATTDIYKGESMHFHVLKTKKPVRGVKMLVGPKKKEVAVNVAPIIVDGQLKGSVGIIHDMSEIRELTTELQRAKERIRTLEAKYNFDDIVGRSEEMLIAIEQARIAAKTPATVLLRGESGTGKELFAHAIHNESGRKYNHFIRVNCAAISESLLESELFGYEEGAFSGAKRGGKKGYFEEANNGSIFLDEIGELSLSTQAKLLRVLQEREIIRVGGTKPISIQVRIIAATNKNLEQEIRKGNFREDLFYRLNRIPIYIPPLRSRLEDIPLLCDHLIKKINHDYGRNVEGITNEAAELLKRYAWPGNVRELENILGRAIIFMDYSENRIDIKHLSKLGYNFQKNQEQDHPNEASLPLYTLVENFEKRIISHILHKHRGNKTKTAKELGVSIRTLYYKMEKYGL
ncbi:MULTISPECIES: sigma-54 interaction domain-containing protein [Bacillaceae]|jgi:PAS domain S-box-containing protein|nr:MULTISPECIES: sigma-54-dependent Fis family transcriptional regulator [Bacillaceae]AWI14222.1 sigma-54-dependent transcriptional regulator [Caldibacillus thermoamylovorans]MBU5341328.1 sigma-54-dependent Fis family transcriptional regulator [Caldifermentibacillus hisashii]MCB7069743.1 sigma-54-dependent Fis family transcriptional regulator [Caldibacillus sp. 210928-DFI.2.22]MCB7073217.1 sigma-54-dependent Fis family transcriptional regulator [Caldibacillus sp. 210928-DFI.2.18]MCM3053104.1 s